VLNAKRDRFKKARKSSLAFFETLHLLNKGWIIEDRGWGAKATRRTRARAKRAVIKVI